MKQNVLSDTWTSPLSCQAKQTIARRDRHRVGETTLSHRLKFLLLLAGHACWGFPWPQSAEARIVHRWKHLKENMKSFLHKRLPCKRYAELWLTGGGTLTATEKVKKSSVVLGIKSRKETKQGRSWMLSAGASHHPFNTLANVLSHYRLVVSQMLYSGQLHRAAPRGWGGDGDVKRC